MAGLQPIKLEVDNAIGTVCKLLQVHFNQIGQFKFWLDAKLDADLITLGYTAQEVAVLRSAFSDLEQLRQLYIGNGTLVAAKDFRAFAKQLWGLGDV